MFIDDDDDDDDDGRGQFILFIFFFLAWLNVLAVSSVNRSRPVNGVSSLLSRLTGTERREGSCG